MEYYLNKNKLSQSNLFKKFCEIYEVIDLDLKLLEVNLYIFILIKERKNTKNKFFKF